METSESELLEEERSFGSVDSLPKTASRAKTKPRSSCRICLSTIFDPARLACGHRFCERCLNRFWKATQEPEFVVCPLCRDCATNVEFVEKEDIDSTWDFRKRFHPNAALGLCLDGSSTKEVASKLCLKISIIMPIIFFVIKYLKPLFSSILTLFNKTVN